MSEKGSAKPHSKSVDFTSLTLCQYIGREGALFWTTLAVIPRYTYPEQTPTVREVALAIGRLGGHLNRKSDGLPGWQTLWHGMNTLYALVEGVLIAPRLRSFG